MKDAKFKCLKHNARGFIKYSDGKEIEKKYSTDYVLHKDNYFILLEHETEPNRKTIVADMIKAAHFLQSEKSGILVIVITPKRNSSLQSYPKHIKKYYDWISDKTNLEEIYFIKESDYSSDNDTIEINSRRFIDLCFKI